MNFSKKKYDIVTTILSFALLCSISYAASLLHWIFGVIIFIVSVLIFLHKTRPKDE